MNGDVLDDTQRVELPVPQTQQKHTWDCGLACAVSCLRYLEKDANNVYSTDLERLGCKESVWTIDLARLMSFHEIPHKLCTTFTGVDKSYSKKSFYARHFTEDERRVNQLFEEAESQGISVEERSVSLEEISSHVFNGDILIILIDWTFLECIWCDMKICPQLNCFQMCCRAYQGHFVVVCGFDKTKGHVYYKNPSYRKELCCSRVEKFEIARKSHGTDEDILFLYKK